MKTSLGIWALGPMITRFVPGGYQPEHNYQDEPTADKVARAIAGLGDLIDGYEFHYPQELSDDNLGDVRQALGEHDIYCMATGLHLDPRFGKGALSSPDAGVRREALDISLRGGRLRRVRGRSPDLLARDRGLQLPVPDPLRALLGLVHRGDGASWRSAATSAASGSSSSTRTPSPR